MKNLWNKKNGQQTDATPVHTKEKKTSVFKSRKFKHSGLAVGLTLIVIVMVVLVNFVVSALAQRYPLSIDMTQNQAFQLSDESKDYIAGLEKEVEIKILASRENFVGQNDYFAQAAQVIEMYDKLSDKISVEYLDLIQNPQIETQYADQQPSNYDILVISGDQIAKLSPTDLFNTVEYYYSYQIISSKAEQTMTSAIMRVTDENKVKVAVLSGHGEADISDFTELMLTNNYEVIDHSVVTEDIPEDVSVVWLVAPSNDYTVEELSRLDTFLDQDGKSLVYFGSAAQPDTPNLDAFLAEWGISVGDGLIFETDANMVFNQNSFFTIVNYASDRFAGDMVSQNIVQTLPYAVPLEKLFDQQGNVKVEELLSFSDTIGVMPKDAQEGFTPSEENMVGSLPGLLYSTRTTSDEKVSHVVACGSTDALLSSLLESTSVGNAEYFLNMMADLSQREDTLKLVDKNITGSELGVNSAQAIVLGTIFVIVVPVVVLVIGLVIWVRRRHR